MAPTSNGFRIVRTWTPLGAPTGETRYETEDGRVWRETFSTPTITGVTYGDVVRDHIWDRR